MSIRLLIAGAKRIDWNLISLLIIYSSIFTTVEYIGGMDTVIIIGMMLILIESHRLQETLEDD